jgi:ACT domain-containing protein
MIVDVTLALRDVPGMLIRALEPVSSNGGNIVSVVHSRSRGGVRVNVIFRVRDEVTLQRILDALRGAKVECADVQVEGRRYFRKRSVSFILIGHVIDRDMQDTIDRINRVGLVRDIEVRMGDPDEESAVLMRVNVDENRMGRLMECVRGVSQKKRFLLISEVPR